MKIDLNGSDSNEQVTAPLYWTSLADWKRDSKFAELASREFASTPMNSKEEGWARREFLKLMGASLALSTFSCVRRPAQKIVPYVERPPEVRPGIGTEYASSFVDGQTEIGIVVVTRQGRPLKVEGNQLHPVSCGGMSARAHAHILNLYDPDRLQEPKKNLFNRQKSNFDTISINWEKADREVVKNLNQGSVALLTPTLLSPSTHSLVKEFNKTFKVDHFIWDPLSLEHVREGEKLCYKKDTLSRYRIENADYILSIGTDFLGTHLSPVGWTKEYSKRRKPNQKMNKLVVFESLFSLTGANADERYSISSSVQIHVLLELIYELLILKKKSEYATLSPLKEALKRYKALSHEKSDFFHELKSIDFSRIADELWNHRGHSIVLTGGIETQTKEALDVQVLSNFLNHLLENDGKTIDYKHSPFLTHKGRYRAIDDLTHQMEKGRIKTLIIHGVNPGFILGKRNRFLSAISKVNKVIYTGDRIDETGVLSDYILPDHHAMENWNDAEFQKGIFSIQQPTIRPLYNTRSFQDSLMIWMRAKNKNLRNLKGVTHWYDYLRREWKKRVRSFTGRNTIPKIQPNFEAFWTDFLKKGFFDTLLSQREASLPKRNFSFAALYKVLNQQHHFQKELSKKKNQDTYGQDHKNSKDHSKNTFELSLYTNAGILDGTLSNISWLQEFPDPITKICWDNHLCVSFGAAQRLNLKEGQVVKLKTKENGVQKIKKVPVHIQPGLSDKTLGLALGYGHWKAGKISDHVGVEAFSFSEWEKNAENAKNEENKEEVDQSLSKTLQEGLQQSENKYQKTVFSGIKAEIEKTNEHYALADLQTHNSMEGRQIIVEATLKEFMKNPASNIHKHKTFSLWEDHKYEGHKWAMAIDLNTCTGCSVCVIACQSENNIPTVGKRNVLQKRQMHWIRVDRYYKGAPKNPNTAFIPITCQHCDNAPCETVCPVVATVHSKEGTNDMIYNRCVGTRYCMNNCPYKVRRFNWFNYSRVESPLHWALNPDVTVRSRGVMEKCTFCIHRIHAAKNKAALEGRTADKNGRILRDGDVKTACQESCPSDAIVFGDMNDPNSQVSRWFREKNAYSLLEELNVKPAFRYKTKIRNTQLKSHTSVEHKENHT